MAGSGASTTSMMTPTRSSTKIHTRKSGGPASGKVSAQLSETCTIWYQSPGRAMKSGSFPSPYAPVGSLIRIHSRPSVDWSLVRGSAPTRARLIAKAEKARAHTAALRAKALRVMACARALRSECGLAWTNAKCIRLAYVGKGSVFVGQCSTVALAQRRSDLCVPPL